MSKVQYLKQVYMEVKTQALNAPERDSAVALVAALEALVKAQDDELEGKEVG